MNGSIFPYNNFTERQTSILQIEEMCWGYTGYYKTATTLSTMILYSHYICWALTWVCHLQPSSQPHPAHHPPHPSMFGEREQSLPHFWRSRVEAVGYEGEEKIALICCKLQIALEMQLKIQGEKMELLNAFSYLGRPQCLTQFAIWSCVSCIKLAPLFLYNWGLNLVYIYFICLTHCRY